MIVRLTFFVGITSTEPSALFRQSLILFLSDVFALNALSSEL